MPRAVDRPRSWSEFQLHWGVDPLISDEEASVLFAMDAAPELRSLSSDVLTPDEQRWSRCGPNGRPRTEVQHRSARAQGSGVEGRDKLQGTPSAPMAGESAVWAKAERKEVGGRPRVQNEPPLTPGFAREGRARPGPPPNGCMRTDAGGGRGQEAPIRCPSPSSQRHFRPAPSALAFPVDRSPHERWGCGRRGLRDRFGWSHPEVLGGLDVPGLG